MNVVALLWTNHYLCQFQGSLNYGSCCWGCCSCNQHSSAIFKAKNFLLFVVRVYPSFCSLKHYLKLFLERMLVDLWYFPAIYQVSKTVIWLGLPLFNVVLSVEWQVYHRSPPQLVLKNYPTELKTWTTQFGVHHPIH